MALPRTHRWLQAARQQVSYLAIRVQVPRLRRQQLVDAMPKLTP